MYNCGSRLTTCQSTRRITKIQFMSLLWCSGLPTPMLAMMPRELG
jgi:hypothetical protein